MLLNRDDWYETSRDLDWTLSYVDPEVAFPARWSGAGDVPAPCFSLHYLESGNAHADLLCRRR